MFRCGLASGFCGNTGTAFRRAAVAVALEQARGAVIESPSSPSMPAWFVPGSPQYAGQGRLEPHTLETRQLQFLFEERRKLVNPHTSRYKRLIGCLKQVFPQILQWFDDPGCGLVRASLLRWPTLLALQKARPKTLRTFFHQHNRRSEERIAERLAQIHRAVPASTAGKIGSPTPNNSICKPCLHVRLPPSASATFS